MFMKCSKIARQEVSKNTLITGVVPSDSNLSPIDQSARNVKQVCEGLAIYETKV